jgi:hypothetical protein
MHAYIHNNSIFPYRDTYTHTHTYSHSQTYIHTCMHTYMHTYIHAYIHTSWRQPTYIHTYIHTYIPHGDPSSGTDCHLGVYTAPTRHSSLRQSQSLLAWPWHGVLDPAICACVLCLLQAHQLQLVAPSVTFVAGASATTCCTKCHVCCRRISCSM